MALYSFAKGRLECRANPNVSFVRLAKIEFEEYKIEKKNNTEALVFGSFNCWFICGIDGLYFIL